MQVGCDYIALEHVQGNLAQVSGVGSFLATTTGTGVQWGVWWLFSTIHSSSSVSLLAPTTIVAYSRAVVTYMYMLIHRVFTTFTGTHKLSGGVVTAN